MNENKIAHLEMIQGIVNRLSQNSFLLKGWNVVLVSALMALAAKDSKVTFILLAYLPAVVFWFLDGYFLWQEKMFRALFDYVRKLDESEINFSMDISKVKDSVDSFSKVTLSMTLISFHGVLIVAIIIVMFLIINQ
jgi:hypothetical protein